MKIQKSLHHDPTFDPSMIPAWPRPWSDDDFEHEDNKPQPACLHRSKSDRRDAFCNEKLSISSFGYLPKFLQILRLPRKVTLQHHQILRLPQKVTLQHQLRSSATLLSATLFSATLLSATLTLSYFIVWVIKSWYIGSLPTKLPEIILYSLMRYDYKWE